MQLLRNGLNNKRSPISFNNEWAEHCIGCCKVKKKQLAPVRWS